MDPAEMSYTDFLNRANQAPNAGIAQSQGTSPALPQLKSVDEGVKIPAKILDITNKRQLVYMSEADNAYQPVCLRWKDTGNDIRLPDNEELAQLIGYDIPKNLDIEPMMPEDWARDPEKDEKTGNTYDPLEQALVSISGGDPVMVFKIPLSSDPDAQPDDITRFEYWMLTRDGPAKDANLVGFRVLAVES